MLARHSIHCARRPAIPDEEREDGFMSRIGKQAIGVGTLVTLLLFIAVVVILPFGASSAARIPHSRTPHSPQSNASATNMIDGSQHPELIPDSTAYRLYLLTVSVPSNSTEGDRRVQSSHLAKAQLDANDLQSMTAVLAAFRSEHDAWLSKYNAEAAAQGATFDPTPFLQQQEDLVNSTRAALAKSLSANGMARLCQHVQGEKKFMKVAVN
jgi:hypothetical protein